MYSETGAVILSNHYMEIAICVLISYIVGNISPAILIGRLHGVDIRNEGSGNAGTTNVCVFLAKKPPLQLY